MRPAAARVSVLISIATPRSLVGASDETSTRSVMPAGNAHVVDELDVCVLTSMVLMTAPVLICGAVWVLLEAVSAPNWSTIGLAVSTPEKLRMPPTAPAWTGAPPMVHV